MAYRNMYELQEKRNRQPKFEDSTRGMSIEVRCDCYVRKGEFETLNASLRDGLHVEVKIDSDKKVVSADVLNDSFDFVCPFLGSVAVK